MMAITSYDVRCVDGDGIPEAKTCLQNKIVESAELIFFAVFALEMIIKILAFGFLFEGPKTYLKDYWSILDFVVVMSSIATLAGSVNISFLRLFRLLRPLKSLSKMPKLRRLITALLESIPSLANVVLLLMFVLLLFSILGLQFFQGYGHSRCRITEFPIRFDHDYCQWDEISVGDPCWIRYIQDVVTNHRGNPSHYMCRDKSGNPLDWDDVEPTLVYIDAAASSGTAKRGVWSEPLDCFWPVDENDEFSCSMRPKNGGYGMHQCHEVYDAMNYSGTGPTGILTRWCGSNFDPFGQPRFTGNEYPFGYKDSRMTSATFLASLSWGYVTFDHLGAALLTIFQSVTMEGWVDVMYIYMDSFNATAAALIFLLLILFGSFFMLNLMLAVITNQIESTPEDEDSEGQDDGEGQGGARNSSPVEMHGSEEGAANQDAKTLQSKAMNGPELAPASDPLVLTDEECGEGPGGEAAGATEQAVSVTGGIASMVEKADVDHMRNMSKSQRRQYHNMKHMHPLRQWLYWVVSNPWFQRFIFVAIIVNTVILALDQHPIERDMDDMLIVLNQVLTYIFALEMLLKVGALGFKEYTSDNYNVFDAVVVFMSILELALESYLAGAGGFSALRAFRIFRVFKMAKDWESLQTLLSTMVQSLMEIGNFFLLLCLFIYIYALMGMQFFANKMRFDMDDGHTLDFKNDPDSPVNDPFYTDIPLSNFDSFVRAVVTIFQVLTGENWNAVMYDARRAAGPGLASLYFISLVIFGAFIVMNIFLAILLSNFENNEDLVSTEPAPSTFSAFRERIGSVANSFSFRSQSYRVGPTTTGESSDLEDEEAAGQLSGEGVDAKKEEGAAQDKASDPGQAAEPGSGTALFCLTPDHTFRKVCTAIATHPNFDNSIVVLIVVSSLLLAVDSPLADPKSWLSVALGILNIIFTAIFAFEAVVKIVHLGFLMNGPHSYLRSPWNILDLVIVIISVIDLLLKGANLSFLRALRTVRVLRPLRMISRQRELKLVVDALLSSLPQIVNVSVVCGLFFLIFAIVGVNCFKGRFHACQGAGWDALTESQTRVVSSPGTSWSKFSQARRDLLVNGTGLSPEALSLVQSCDEDRLKHYVKQRGAYPDQITSRDVCVCWLGKGSWDKVMPGWDNFDNVFSAIGLLYEISTTEGWVDIMNHAAAGTGPYMQPKREVNQAAILYFVVFMLFGAFFVMQLFVGVIIERFNQIREENMRKGRGSKVLMTNEQQQWARTVDFIQNIKPFVKPTPRVQVAFDAISHPWFDPFIMVCISLNALVMGIQYHGMSEEMSEAIFWTNMVFAVIFTLEMALKLLGVGFPAYWRDNWNRFDFLIVWGTWGGVIIKFTLETDVGSVASIVRMFRIGRILRLLHSCKTLKHLFNTFIKSLPSLTNVGGLLAIILFMYSVLGVQLFALYELNSDLNEHAHFQGFWMSMLTLFRFSTGENWNGMMHSMSERSDTCEDNPSYNDNWCIIRANKGTVGCVPLNKCGEPAVLYLYFYSFTLCITLVMLNLFIGIILDAFGETDEENSTLSAENLAKFMDTWSEHDPTASWHLRIDRLKPFIQELSEPMGFGRDYIASDHELEQEILNLRLVVRHEELLEGLAPGEIRLHVFDVATALARRVARRIHGEQFQELPDGHPSSHLDDQEPADTHIRKHFEAEQAVQQERMATMEEVTEFPAATAAMGQATRRTEEEESGRGQGRGGGTYAAGDVGGATGNSEGMKRGISQEEPNHRGADSPRSGDSDRGSSGDDPDVELVESAL